MIRCTIGNYDVDSSGEIVALFEIGDETLNGNHITNSQIRYLVDKYFEGYDTGEISVDESVSSDDIKYLVLNDASHTDDPMGEIHIEALRRERRRVPKRTPKPRTSRKLITDSIGYEVLSYGGYLVKNERTGEDMLVQVDYDFPSLAETFGWNGKITFKDLDAAHRDKLGAQIYRAVIYLDEHEGKIVSDPGYFD